MQRIGFFSGLGYKSLSIGLTSVGNLVLLGVYARYLTSNELGTYAILTTVWVLASNLLDLGWSQLLFSAKEGQDKLASSLIWVSVIGGVFWLGIISFLAPFLAPLFQLDGLNDQLLLFFLAAPVQGINNVFTAELTRTFRVARLALIEMASFIVFFVLVIIFFALSWGLLSVILAHLGRTIAFFLMVIWKNEGMISFRRSIDWSALFEYRSFAFFQSLRFLAGYGMKKVDILLIGSFLGPGTLGVYNLFRELLTKAGDIGNKVNSSMLLPTLSVLFKEDPNRLHLFFKRNFLLFSFVYLAVYCGLYLFAPELIELIFGARYLSELGVFRLLCIYLIFWTALMPAANLVTASGKVAYGMYWNLILILVMTLSFILGMGKGLQLVILLWAFTEVLLIPIYFKEVIYPIAGLPWKKLVRLFLSTALMSVFALWLPGYLVPGDVPLWGRSAIFTFLIVLLFFMPQWYGEAPRDWVRLNLDQEE